MTSEPYISIRAYFAIFIALLVLLFLSVGIAFIPSGEHHALRDLLTAVGFTIAGAKAVLIILWFMHVKLNGKLVWVFASAAFFWLLILFGLTLTDYSNRGNPAPGHSAQVVEMVRRPR